MAEEELIIEQQQPPQLPQPQKKQQQQPQQIKADDKEKGKTALSEEDKKLFGKLEDKYNFEWKKKRAGAAVTRVGNDIIFVKKIPTGAAGYAKFKNGPYLILKTNIENFKKFIDNEVAKKEAEEAEEAEGMADEDAAKQRLGFDEDAAKQRLGFDEDAAKQRLGFDEDAAKQRLGFDEDEEKKKEKKEDNIIFEYFNFSKDYFDKNEKLFADSLKQKKFLFNNLGEEKKEEEKDVNYLGWNNFKKLNIIPGINKKKTYKDTLKDFNIETIQDNIFVIRENAKKEKDLFGIGDEKPIEEQKEELLPKKPLPKKEDVKIEDDIDNSDSKGMIDTEDEDIQEINTQDLKPQEQEQQQLVAQDNQLINAGHTPNGEELKALIKYNNNSDSLLKLIVSLSNDNKGEIDLKEIGEIQDLNGDITKLYSDMQDLKSKIKSSNNAEEKERLLFKYNKKRLKLEDRIKKYSKEAYRLSMMNKKKKATFSNPKYIKNKLNKL